MEGVPLLSERNILDRRRTMTDPILFCIFISLFIFWIGIILYAYIAGDSSLFPPEFLDKITTLFNVSRIFVVIGYILLAGFYTTLFFIAMQYISNFLYVIFASIWILFVSSIVSIIYVNNFSSIVLSCGSLAGLILINVLIHTEWFHLPERVLKESCKLILAVPSTLLFSSISHLFCIIVAAITIITTFYLNTPSAHIATFQTLNIICGYWTLTIIWSLQQMVLYGTFSIWFWTPNKEEVTIKTVLRYLKLILKYHIGTIAYGTSIFGVIVTLCLLIRRAIGKLLAGCNAKVILFIIYNIFDPILFKYMIIGAFVKCVTHGKGYCQSMLDAYEYFENYTRRCLLVFKMVEYLILCAVSTISLLMMLALFDYMSNLPSGYADIFYVPIILGCFFVVVPLLSTLLAAYSATFFALLEDLEENDGSEAKPYAMSAELQSAVNHPGPPRWYRNCQSCAGAIPDENTADVAERAGS